MKLSASLAILLLIVGPCVGCTSCDLRLTNISHGILHICKSNGWRSVCSEDWGHLDAAVACKQLKYDGGYTQSTRSYTQSNTVDPVVYHCNGTENSLKNCSNEPSSRCRTYDVATIVCVRRNASDCCSSGDIRLWGGQTEYEGNIEMCTDHGVWSAVCDSSWSIAGAVVACRQLGYTGIALPYSHSTFGQRIQPMEFGGLQCSGTESSLQECPVSRSYVRTWSRLIFCNQRDYAGVRCIPRSTATCTNGDVRLRNGYSHNNGFAEICIDGIWIAACLDQHRQSTVISSHVCNQLGYPPIDRVFQGWFTLSLESTLRNNCMKLLQWPGYTGIDQSFFPSNRSEPQAYVRFDGYRCNAESSVLLDCVRNSSSYGVSYLSSCSTNGILCCPNDTAMCCFQPRSPVDPTTPPFLTTQPTPSIDEEDKAEFSLDFGTAATYLMSSFGDLRGLEEDIQNRVVNDISGKCNCSFNISALEGGFFSFGESVTYHCKVLGVAGQSAASLVIMLKECIEKDPLIQYHFAETYLVAAFVA